jgi:hypothetical protein
MHILLITDAYPPEVRSASHLMYELAVGLVERGQTVTVLTSVPTSPVGRARGMNMGRRRLEFPLAKAEYLLSFSTELGEGEDKRALRRRDEHDVFPTV